MARKPTSKAPAAAPLAIVYRPLDSLRPYARNARRHSRTQLDKLKASLTRFGWAVPMAVAGNDMIAGHGRLMAALELRDEGIAIRGNPDPSCGPTVDLSHLSAEERRLYVLADNRLSDDSDWDPERLRVELADLQALGIDLGVTGFELGEIKLAIEGWNPDFKKIDDIEAELSGLTSTIKVRCASDDEDAVRKVLTDALAASGIEGATVEA